MKNLSIISLLLLITLNPLKAQTISEHLKVSGYIETYYVYDMGMPNDHVRPDFLYSFNRHNELNLNLGFIQMDYNDDRVRGRLALMTGTYANSNLSAEPDLYRNIFEANVGIKLSEDKNLWLDAGIFASHIGFESAIGADTWNMTRSILAENSPYFLTGAKLTYQTNDGQWLMSALLLNGWQRIQRVPGNQTPAFGHQISWMPTERFRLNSSSFIGSDTPDQDRRMRYFHNLYAQYQLNQHLGLIAGFDIGLQQKSKGSSDYNRWIAPVIIMRYSINEDWAVATRVEYYQDRDQVIIATNTSSGFDTFGFSVNLDRQITERVLWRTEVRTFNSREDHIFIDRDQNPAENNVFMGTSLSIKF